MLINKKSIFTNFFINIYELEEELILSKNQTFLCTSNIVNEFFYMSAMDIERAVLDLIDNASSYSSEKITIKMVVKFNSENLLVSIEDEGIGFNFKDLKNLPNYLYG